MKMDMHVLILAYTAALLHTWICTWHILTHSNAQYLHLHIPAAVGYTYMWHKMVMMVHTHRDFYVSTCNGDSEGEEYTVVHIISDS